MLYNYSDLFFNTKKTSKRVKSLSSLTHIKGVEEESLYIKPQREITVGVSYQAVVLNCSFRAERKKGICLVEPLRYGCVNAYGLIEPEWQFIAI